jgi:hypothetical protein
VTEHSIPLWIPSVLELFPEPIAKPLFACTAQLSTILRNVVDGKMAHEGVATALALGSTTRVVAVHFIAESL